MDNSLPPCFALADCDQTYCANPQWASNMFAIMLLECLRALTN